MHREKAVTATALLMAGLVLPCFVLHPVAWVVFYVSLALASWLIWTPFAVAYIFLCSLMEEWTKAPDRRPTDSMLPREKSEFIAAVSHELRRYKLDSEQHRNALRYGKWPMTTDPREVAESLARQELKYVNKHQLTD